MYSRNLSRIVVAVLLAAVLTAAPAAALGGPFAGRGALAWLWDLVENIWSEEGGSIDPDGRPAGPVSISAPEGGSIDPNGVPRSDEGGSIDPNG
jgi:hypothetical protein